MNDDKVFHLGSLFAEENLTDPKTKQKDKQNRLSTIIKGAHARLRQQLKNCRSYLLEVLEVRYCSFKDCGDYDAAWNAHCQDTFLLSEYSKAMHQLATEVWTNQQRQTRIDWCHATCLEYFAYKGGLYKALLKDARRKTYDNLKSIVPVCDSNSETARDFTSSVISSDTSINSTTLFSEVQIADSPESNTMFLASPIDSHTKLRLLDVGSCFNGFQLFEEFLSVGIDLSPAVESVLACDFLNLHISSPFHSDVSSIAITDYLQSLQSPVTELPEAAFHIVVFSLLLEYLPSPNQRWMVCVTAHRLLALHGLLVVITPDSHHVGRRAQQMKDWRKAIESIGFKRWRYEKQDHLHCMVFRKTDIFTCGSMDPLTNESVSSLLYIPQDSKGWIDEDNDAS